MRIVFSLVAFCLLLTASPASAACTFDATATWSVPVSDIYKAHNGPYENAFSKNVTMPADSVRLVTEVTVTPPGCYYSETALPAWFGSMSTSGGYEGGKMTRIIPANTSNAPRTGIYTVAGININVTQLPSCNFCSGSSTHPRECQYIACESTAVWKRCPSSNCDTAGYTSGVKIKDNTKNVLFDQDYNYGMARFVSNKTGTDIFVPQNTKDEFASFLSSDLFNSRKKSANTYAIDWGYAVRDNASVPFQGGAKDYAGCPATSFSSVGGGTIAVPGAVAESITVPYDEERVRVSANGYTYTKQPLNPLDHSVKPTPLSVVLGSADVNSPIKYGFDRHDYDGDCITDNQGTRSCPPAGAVVFTQFNKVIFKAKEISAAISFSYRGITFKNYGWAVAEENPVDSSSLYVSIKGGANTAVSDCTDGYPEAALPINGQCGTAHNTTVTTKPAATPPSTVLCVKGNASVVSGSGPWTWTCNGVGTGATNANCSAGAAGCPTGTAVNWTVDSYNCTSNTTSNVNSGSTISVTSTEPDVGNATFLCTSGALTKQSGTCSAGASCPWAWKAWKQGGEWVGDLYMDRCENSLPVTASGTSQTISYSSSPVQGSATYSCNNGTWTGPTSASCGRSASCPAGTVSWGSCSGPIGSAYSGNSWGVTSNNGNIGNANYDCSGSTWVLRAGSDCSAPATTCPAGTKTWTSGSTCTGNIAETSIGSTANANTPVGSANSGSASYRCDSGGIWFGPITANCGAASCPLTNVTWGPSNKCSATLPASPNGPKDVSYSSGTTTGSATYTCSGSAWSGPAAGYTCTTSCTGGTKSWRAGGVLCTGSVPNLASGQHRIVGATNAGREGSAKYTCNEGEWVVSDQVCSLSSSGVCGSAANDYSATTPTALCSSGTASAVTGGTGATPFSWTCGGTVNCSTRAPKQCTRFIYETGNYSLPGDVLLGGEYTVQYKIKGGGGGAPGTGGAPGGGGGSSSITISGSPSVIAEGGMGGGKDHGDGGSIQDRYAPTEAASYRLWGSSNRNFSLVIGGGGGAGGSGSKGGGGGGGAGVVGGGGGAGCVNNNVYHGGGGNGYGSVSSNDYGGQGTRGGGTMSGIDGSSASGGTGGAGGTCKIGSTTYGGGGGGGSGSTGGNAGTTANGGNGGGGGGAQSSWGGNSGSSGTTNKESSPVRSEGWVSGSMTSSIVDNDTAVYSGGGKPGGAKFFYWAPACTW